MAWHRIKKVFKKKKEKFKDPVVDFSGEEGATLIEKVYQETIDTKIPDGMRVHTKLIKKVSAGRYLYEVNGVLLEASDILEVQRKYLRGKK